MYSTGYRPILQAFKTAFADIEDLNVTPCHDVRTGQACRRACDPPKHNNTVANPPGVVTITAGIAQGSTHPTVSSMSPVFSQKSPIFSQKSPTFSQKSPAFSRKSSVFSQTAARAAASAHAARAAAPPLAVRARSNGPRLLRYRDESTNLIYLRPANLAELMSVLNLHPLATLVCGNTGLGVIKYYTPGGATSSCAQPPQVKLSKVNLLLNFLHQITMGWLQLVGSLNDRSLLQKSSIKETIFCKRDLYFK